MGVRDAVRTHGLFIATLLVVLAGTIIVASRPVEPEVARLNARLANSVSTSGNVEITELQKQLIQTQVALVQTEKALSQNQEALRLALNPNAGSSPPSIAQKVRPLDINGYITEIRHIRDAIYSANREIIADERSLRQNLIALAANRQALAFADLDLEIARGDKPPDAQLPQKNAGDFLSADELSIPTNAVRQPAGIAILSKPLSGSLQELKGMAIEETALLSDCENSIRAEQRRIGEIEAQIRQLQERIGKSHLDAQSLRSASKRTAVR